MPGILKRLSVVSLLVLALSTPWSLIQSLAWVNMLVTYSRQANFKQAIQMTFDGKHPCRLCHLARQTERQQRQLPGTSPLEEKLQLGLPPETIFLIDPPAADPACTRPASLLSRTEQPPYPPPRFA